MLKTELENPLRPRHLPKLSTNSGSSSASRFMGFFLTFCHFYCTSQGLIEGLIGAEAYPWLGAVG
jgi:hypothetical protein